MEDSQKRDGSTKIKDGGESLLFFNQYNGGNMVQVKDKTGRILYTVEPQKKTNRRQVVNYIINALMFGICFYGFMVLWAIAELMR